MGYSTWTCMKINDFLWMLTKTKMRSKKRKSLCILFSFISKFIRILLPFDFVTFPSFQVFPMNCVRLIFHSFCQWIWTLKYIYPNSVFACQFRIKWIFSIICSDKKTFIYDLKCAILATFYEFQRMNESQKKKTFNWGVLPLPKTDSLNMDFYLQSLYTLSKI